MRCGHAPARWRAASEPGVNSAAATASAGTQIPEGAAGGALCERCFLPGRAAPRGTPRERIVEARARRPCVRPAGRRRGRASVLTRPSDLRGRGVPARHRAQCSQHAKREKQFSSRERIRNTRGRARRSRREGAAPGPGGAAAPRARDWIAARVFWPRARPSRPSGDLGSACQGLRAWGTMIRDGGRGNRRGVSARARARPRESGRPPSRLPPAAHLRLRGSCTGRFSAGSQIARTGFTLAAAACSHTAGTEPRGY